ncbi:MAG: hypothetical protein ACE14W_04900 [Candidatus Velamenicoccus archaeovorus]
MASHRSSEPAPDPAAEELDRLRAIVLGTSDRPGLVEVLPRLQRGHRKELRRREHWTSGDLARHPEPREVIRSRRKPGNVDQHGRFIQIFDARRELVEDIHENRVVRHAAESVRRRLLALDEPEAVALLGQLEAAMAQAPFLRTVGELRSRPTEPTATLAGDPLYRAVFQSWLELAR